jgi:cyanophycinase
MAIGGAEDKGKVRSILTTFVALAGGRSARIVVIPAASTEAAYAGALYQSLFTDLHAEWVEVIQVDTRLDAQDEAKARLLDDATAIFLTGGNQLRLATLMGGTRLGDAIRSRHATGAVVAGTSAGASILCQNMIAFGRSGEWPTQRMVQLAVGLGLTNRVIIDQHFQRRGRTGRLMVAVAHNPYLIGLGIDEDTAVVLNDQNRMDVIGRGSVIIVDGAEMSYTDIDQVRHHRPVAITDMRLHVLTQGARYDLVSRRPEIPALARVYAT